jgi:FkbM family methyltransferase
MINDSLREAVGRTLQKFRAYMGSLAVGGIFESIIENLYRTLLRPGDVAIDIGANHGRHTLPMARAVGPTGKVHAFEPIPEIRRRLTAAIEAAGCSASVEVHPEALSHHAGHAEFHVILNDEGYSGLQRKNYPFEPREELIHVPVARLDDLVDESECIRFIKADVEGGEFHAVQGATRILATRRPVVVFESSKGEAAQFYGYSVADFFAYFAAHDYLLSDILGLPFLPEHWDTFAPWYVVATPAGDAAGVRAAHATAIADAMLELPWGAAST